MNVREETPPTPPVKKSTFFSGLGKFLTKIGCSIVTGVRDIISATARKFVKSLILLTAIALFIPVALIAMWFPGLFNWVEGVGRWLVGEDWCTY
jgi:hypothetical protein